MTFDQWFASIYRKPFYLHFLWLNRAICDLEEYLEFSNLTAQERRTYIGTDGDVACGILVATHLPVICGKALWPGLDDVALRKKWYQTYLADKPGVLSEQRFLDAVRHYNGCREPMPLEYQFDEAIFIDPPDTDTSRIRQAFALTCLASVYAAAPLFFEDISRFGEPREIPFVLMTAFGIEHIEQEARKYYDQHPELQQQTVSEHQ